ncbi:hypothetical protein [Pseudoalteromonas sp. A25]|nr:hypothetical protein [Pseudoalteromonas sp. A25]
MQPLSRINHVDKKADEHRLVGIANIHQHVQLDFSALAGAL